MLMKMEIQKQFQLQSDYFIRMKKQNVYIAQKIYMAAQLIPFKNYQKNSNQYKNIYFNQK